MSEELSILKSCLLKAIIEKFSLRRLTSKKICRHPEDCPVSRYSV